jgi:hypothetical protein
MATGTVTIHFAPFIIHLEDFDELLGERLAGNEIIGLASKTEIIDAIKEMLQEGDFDSEITTALEADKLVNKIEISDDATIDGIQPEDEESK